MALMLVVVSRPMDIKIQKNKGIHRKDKECDQMKRGDLVLMEANMLKTLMNAIHELKSLSLL